MLDFIGSNSGWLWHQSQFTEPTRMWHHILFSRISKLYNIPMVAAFYSLVYCFAFWMLCFPRLFIFLISIWLIDNQKLVKYAPGKINKHAAAAATKSLQSCPTLCNPIDGSPPGSPIPGILQARTLEWVAISFSNAWKWKVKVKSLSQSCPTLSMDCSLPGSSVHGIFQARVLEWGAIALMDPVKWLWIF